MIHTANVPAGILNSLPNSAPYRIFFVDRKTRTARVDHHPVNNQVHFYGFPQPLLNVQIKCLAVTRVWL